MGKDTVRMGKSKNSMLPRIIAVLIVVALVGAAVYGAMAFLSSDSKLQVEKKSGCRSDVDCNPGTMCAAGGCLIMLSSEHRGIWEDDIAAQKNPAIAWKPPSTFGQKIPETNECPLLEGKVRKSDYKHVVPLVRVNLYEFDDSKIALHSLLKAKGTMWLESLRFAIPRWVDMGKAKLCGSELVDKYSASRPREGEGSGQWMDVSLKQSLPVGGIAEAALKVVSDLPEADAEGFKSITIVIAGLEESETAGHTILAFPLGSSLVSIEGPPPAKQRLLTKYVAYYWDHKKERSEISVRFKVPEFSQATLNIDEVNP